jgi:hypothetical protein
MGSAAFAVISIFAVFLNSGGTSRLADRRVPDQPEFAIDLPIDSNRAVSILQRALIGAGVPSGIEQAPLGSDPERASRGQVKESLRFNGRTVRDVLDDFVAFDPRYDWQEEDGRILIRPQTTRGTEGLLQTRLPDFELRSVPLPEAMVRFAGIALTSEHSFMKVHFRQGEVRSERTVSVRLRHPTVLGALDALSRAAGSLSWTVRYGGHEGTGDLAQVSLVAADTAYVLSPPRKLVIEKGGGGTPNP